MRATTQNLLMLILLCLTASVLGKTRTRKVLNKSLIQTPLRISASSYHSRPASSERSGCFIDTVEDLLKTYKERIETYEKICSSLGDHQEFQKYFLVVIHLGKLQAHLHKDKHYQFVDEDKEMMTKISITTLSFTDDIMKLVKVFMLHDPNITSLPIFFQERAITLTYLKYANAYLQTAYAKAPKGECVEIDIKVLQLLPYLFYDLNEELSELFPKDIIDKKIVINPTGFNYGGYAIAFWVGEDNTLLTEPVKLFNGFKQNENVFSLTMDFGPKFVLHAGDKTEVINTVPDCSQLTFVMLTIEKKCDDFQVNLILRQAYSNERYNATISVPGAVIENLEIVFGDNFRDPQLFTHFKYSLQDEFRIFGKLAQKEEKALVGNVEKCDEKGDDCVYHSIPNQCQACKEGVFMQDGKCLTECPPNTIVNDKGECIPCTSDCLTCADSTSCKECAKGKFLLHGKCVDECPSNMFPDANNNCKLCDQNKNCSICESTTKCSKCIPPFKLNKGKCVEECPKGTHYDAIDNKCYDCPSQCAACTSNTECTECVDPFFLSPKQKCVPTCESGFFSDSADKTCKPCIEHCSQCNNNQECEKCTDGFKVTEEKKCEIICKPGQVPLKDICIDCFNSENCLECNPINIKQCLSCKPPTILKGDICVNDCGEGMYKKEDVNKCLPCSENCIACKDAVTCKECKAPKLLFEGSQCVDFCPERNVAVEKECKKCENEDCRLCETDLETCTKCYLPKILKEGRCVTDCGNGYFNDKEECKKCPNDCSECEDAFTCDKCDEGKFLNDVLCVDECPSGTRPNPDKECEKCSINGCKKCDDDKTVCEVCEGKKVLYNNECLETCPEGTFVKEGSNICEDCSQNCQLCNDETICMKCDPGFVLQGTICKEKCDEGYYSWFDVCSPCQTEDCKTCNADPTKCDSCIEAKVLTEGQCEVTCPDGTYNKTDVCTPCQSPCETCINATDCLTCEDTFFIIEGTNKCTNNCTDGQVLVNEICKECEDQKCKVCKPDLTTCVEPKDPDDVIEDGKVKPDCSIHHYLDGFICKPCSENCDKCENENKCTLCIAPFLLLNDKCVSDCGDNFVPIDSTCTKCDPECKKCKPDDVAFCTECYGDKLILNGDCYETCPKGTYKDDNTCKPCNDQSCSECSSEGKTCDKCKLGFVLSEGKCITPPCPVGTTNLNGECEDCAVKDCANCDIIINQCVFCKDKSVLVNPYQCSETCPTGTYPKELETSPGVFVCKNCQRNCDKCDDKQCLKCTEPYVLQDSICVTECDAGSFNNNGVCEKCKEEHCKKCNKDTCFSCEKPLLLQDNKCVEKCDKNQFVDFEGKCVNCSKDCLECTNAQTCTLCDAHMKLQKGQCVDDCGEGQVSDDKNNCLICETPSTCLKCSKDELDDCVECKGNAFLLDNTCVQDCGKGYFPDGKKCHPCLPKCDVCPNGSECYQCETGSVLHKNQCLSQCPNGFYQQTGKCIECPTDCTKCNNQECTQCAPGKLLEDGKCVSACTPGHYQKNELECGKCSESCLQCLGPKDCTMCSPGLVIGTDGTCLLVCKEGEININGKCQACDKHCKKCVDTADKCEVCEETYLLNKDKCVDKCPPAKYPEGNKCLPCVANCSICTNGQSCDLCTPPFALNPLTQPCGYRNCEAPINLSNICSECKKGETIVDGHCVKCKPENCSECKETVEQCSKCDEGFSKFNGKCVKNCPESTYKVPSTNECKECKKECLTCTAEEVCTTCKQGFFFENNKCVSSCTDGSMTTEGICADCQVKDCQVCNLDLSGCEKCKDGLLKIVKEGVVTCLAECPSGYHEQGKECVPCSEPNCLNCPKDICIECTPETALQGTKCQENCDVGYAERNNECFKCSDKFCLKCDPLDLDKCEKCKLPFVLKKNKCKDDCDDEYYEKDFGTHIECHKCPENCEKCIDGNICKECDDDYVLKEGKCETSCGKGYVEKDDECHKCQTEHCVECLPHDTEGCKKCDKDYFLSKDGTCVKDCGTGMIDKNGICIDCSEFCLVCKSNGECTQCAPGKFLFEGNCVNKCDPTYSPDTNNECQPCDNKNCDTCNLVTDKCLTCPKGKYLSEGDCVEQCPEGTFTNGDKCTPCLNNCAKCFNEKECSKCEPPLVLNDGRCQDNCPKFEVDVDGVCTPCTDNVNCYQCSKEDLGKCVDCKEGTNLMNSVCVTVCPDGTFPSNGKCLPCYENCKDCSSATTCNECVENFAKHNNMCVEDCPKGTSEIKKECVACKDPSCEKCPGDINKCEKCRDPAFPDDGKCITNCGIGKYYDKEDKKCQPCVEGCVLCENDSVCQKCNNTLALTPEGQCKDQCAEGQYKHPTDSKCTPCTNKYCSQCDPFKPNSCIECSNNLLKIHLPGGEYDCIVSCPEDHYADKEKEICIPCKAPCKTCKDDTVCDTCIPPLVLNDGKCTSTCDSGEVERNGICIKCSVKNCELCNANDLQKCLICEKPFILFKDECYEHCPNKYFNNTVTNNCDECSPKCATCENSEGCLTCIEDHYFVDKTTQCEKCLPPNIIKDTTCLSCQVENCNLCDASDEEVCKECKAPYLLFNETCVDKCPDGFSQVGQKCIPCIEGCVKCIDQSTCLQCKEGKLSSFGKCVDECPNNHRENNGICEKCASPNCVSCPTAADKCEVCENQLLYQGECLNTCPPNTMISNNTCLECPTNCSICNAQGCVECDTGKVLKDKQCVEDCGLGYYQFLETCKKCEDPLCEKCTAHKCEKCQGDAKLQPLSFETCEVTCPLGYFIKSDSDKCEKCELGCAKCTADKCEACLENYAMHNGVCVNTCPEKMTPVNGECTQCEQETCKKCAFDHPEICEECTNKNNDGKCVDECPKGTFDKDGKCTPCEPRCDVCTSETECIKCQPEFFLSKGDCVNSCGDGQVLFQGICLPCEDEKCLACSEDTKNCYKCEAPKFLYKGDCVDTCPKKTYPDKETNTCKPCDKKCEICLNAQVCEKCARGYFMTLTQECSEHCPDGTYEACGDGSRECKLCDVSCKTCVAESNTDCLACADGYISHQEKCIKETECPAGTYLSDKQCKDCQVSYCKTCTDAVTCAVCDRGFSLTADLKCELAKRITPVIKDFVLATPLSYATSILNPANPEIFPLINYKSTGIGSNSFSIAFYLKTLSPTIEKETNIVSLTSNKQDAYNFKFVLGSDSMCKLKVFEGENLINTLVAGDCDYKKLYHWTFFVVSITKQGNEFKIVITEGKNANEYSLFISTNGRNDIVISETEIIINDNTHTAFNIGKMNIMDYVPSPEQISTLYEHTPSHCDYFCLDCQSTCLACPENFTPVDGRCQSFFVQPKTESLFFPGGEPQLIHLSALTNILSNDKFGLTTWFLIEKMIDDEPVFITQVGLEKSYNDVDFFKILLMKGELFVGNNLINSTIQLNHWYFISVIYSDKEVSVHLQDQQGLNEVKKLPSTGFNPIYNSFIYKFGSNFYGSILNAKVYINNAPTVKDIENDFSKMQCPAECKQCGSSLKCEECNPGFVLDNGMCFEQKAEEKTFVQLLNIEDIWNQKSKKYELPKHSSMTISLNLRKKAHSYIYKEHKTAAILSLITEDATSIPVVIQELVDNFNVDWILDPVNKIKLSKDYSMDQFEFLSVVILIRNSISKLTIKFHDIATNTEKFVDKTFSSPITHIEIGDNTGYEINMEYSNMKAFKGIANDELITLLQAQPFKLNGTCSKYNFATKKCKVCLNVEQPEETDCNCGIFGFHETYLSGETSYAAIAEKEDQFTNVIYDTQSVNINRDKFSIMISFKFSSIANGKYRIGCYSNDYLRLFAVPNSRGKQVVCLEALMTGDNGISLLLNINDNEGVRAFVAVPNLLFQKNAIVRGLIGIDTTSKKLEYSFVVGQDTFNKYSGVYLFTTRPDRLQPSGGLKLFGINDGLDETDYRVPSMFVNDFAIMASLPFTFENFDWLLKNVLALKPEDIVSDPSTCFNCRNA